VCRRRGCPPKADGGCIRDARERLSNNFYFSIYIPEIFEISGMCFTLKKQMKCHCSEGSKARSAPSETPLENRFATRSREVTLSEIEGLSGRPARLRRSGGRAIWSCVRENINHKPVRLLFGGETKNTKKKPHCCGFGFYFFRTEMTLLITFSGLRFI
jgi:hypothetical protein